MNLIDEILTYARLEEGGPILDFQRANVAAIADQVVPRSPSAGSCVSELCRCIAGS